MADFLLKARSKPVSYKRENQKVIIDADRENEKKAKGEPSDAATTRKKHSGRWQFYSDRDIRDIRV